MANETKYPKRGTMSADGKLYTHHNGAVHGYSGAKMCQKNHCEVCRNKPYLCTHWLLVEGAYVPSAEEQAACDMARAHIPICGSAEGMDDCRECLMLEERTCHLRAYLAAHGDATAWEVAT